MTAMAYWKDSSFHLTLHTQSHEKWWDGIWRTS